MSARFFHLLQHVAVNGCQVLFGHQSATYTALISNDVHLFACLVHRSHRLFGSGHEHELFRGAHVVAHDMHVDGSVPVKQDGGVGGNIYITQAHVFPKKRSSSIMQRA